MTPARRLRRTLAVCTILSFAGLLSWAAAHHDRQQQEALFTQLSVQHARASRALAEAQAELALKAQAAADVQQWRERGLLAPAALARYQARLAGLPGLALQIAEEPAPEPALHQYRIEARVRALHEGELWPRLEALLGGDDLLLTPRECTLERLPESEGERLAAQCALQLLALDESSP